jgi:hypothetical protein
MRPPIKRISFEWETCEPIKKHENISHPITLEYGKARYRIITVSAHPAQLMGAYLVTSIVVHIVTVFFVRAHKKKKTNESKAGGRRVSYFSLTDYNLLYHCK